MLAPPDCRPNSCLRAAVMPRLRLTADCRPNRERLMLATPLAGAGIASPSVLLLQIDGLVMRSLVELCAPHLVHALVVGPAEDHGRAEPNVEIAQIFQSPD
jgi:hypothetical protein